MTVQALHNCHSEDTALPCVAYSLELTFATRHVQCCGVSFWTTFYPGWTLGVRRLESCFESIVDFQAYPLLM